MENLSRPRLDSIHGMMSEQRDFKRLKTTDQRWKKVEKTIMQPQTQLILIEVPKGVITYLSKNTIVRCKHPFWQSRLEKASAESLEESKWKR
jgi:hypothetical protein